MCYLLSRPISEEPVAAVKSVMAFILAEKNYFTKSPYISADSYPVSDFPSSTPVIPNGNKVKLLDRLLRLCYHSNSLSITKLEDVFIRASENV